MSSAEMIGKKQWNANRIRGGLLGDDFSIELVGSVSMKRVGRCGWGNRTRYAL